MKTTSGHPPPGTLVTERLTLRPPTVDDAAFFLSLFNDPAFIQFIGDREIRSDEQALNYILDRRESDTKSGNVLFVVARSVDAQSIGICSLLNRDELDAPDIGFAFLPEYRKQGFALEAASATLGYAQNDLGIKRIVAVCSAENEKSIALLKKLGLHYESKIHLDNCCTSSLMFSIQTGRD